MSELDSPYTISTTICPPTPMSCQPKIQPLPTQQRISVMKGVCEPKPFNLDLDFSDVDALRNLQGYVYIDPCCGGSYSIKIRGEVAGFANLTNFVATSSNTLSFVGNTINLANGLKELTLTGNVPLKVNGSAVPIPGIAGGYNFRNPTASELPINNIGVNVFAGAGSTAGDIYFTVDTTTLSAGSNIRTFQTVNYDNTTTNINVAANAPFKIISASNALSIIGSDVNDSASLELRIDNATTYNEITVNSNGLLAYHVPYSVDTTTNINITYLDTDSGSAALPLGAVAVWKNTNTTGAGVLIRKVATTGSNQWQSISTLSNSVTVSDTSTVDLTLTGSNITASIPLRITNAGTIVTPPTGGTAIGYQMQSLGNSVAITNPSAGVVNFEVGTVVSVTDSSTVNLSSTGNNISADVPFRVNGVTVTPPTGATPVGINFTSSGSTVAVTNPTAGVINLESSFTATDTSTADVTVSGNTVAVVIPLRINGSTATTPAGTSPIGYNISSTTLTITQPVNGEIAINSRNNYTGITVDTALTGTTNINSTGNILILVSPAGNLSANRIRNLSNTNAVQGDIVTVQTYDLNNTNLAGFSYQVTADTGALNATPISLQPNSIYEFAFNGGAWIRTK